MKTTTDQGCTDGAASRAEGANLTVVLEGGNGETMCINWREHDWQKVGSERIPAHGIYYTNMPLEPTGTVEYEIFRCRHCGQETRQERLYSYQENEPFNV